MRNRPALFELQRKLIYHRGIVDLRMKEQVYQSKRFQHNHVFAQSERRIFHCVKRRQGGNQGSQEAEIIADYLFVVCFNLNGDIYQAEIQGHTDFRALGIHDINC